jgi:adenylylsulfate kinase
MIGTLVWITGLPASGKSTLARAALAQLRERRVAACVLDSDDVRTAVFPHLGYSDDDRDEFYRGLGELAVLLARQGLVVLVAATANKAMYRQAAREAAPRFIEVYVDTDPDSCAERDFKGLYAGEADGSLPGRGAVYERPESPDLLARGGRDRTAVDALVESCAQP